MGLDVFLKIDGIDGESSDHKHKSWIEVLSYSMGVSQPTGGAVSTAGGGTAQRANFHEFTFTKVLDKSSPKIALACADGTHIKEIILEVCRAGGTEKVKYYEIKMNECIISAYRPAGNAQSAETIPMEEVAVDYGKIIWTYTQQQRKDGSPGGNVAGGWDRTSNQPIK
ncbi:MAG: type VI secretion system tube protein Hcp [Syntrophaceae bacterium]